MGYKTRIGKERDYCGHWQVREGRKPASASTGERGAHDGALVKKEARCSCAVIRGKTLSR